MAMAVAVADGNGTAWHGSSSKCEKQQALYVYTRLHVRTLIQAASAGTCCPRELCLSLPYRSRALSLSPPSPSSPSPPLDAKRRETEEQLQLQQQQQGDER